MMPDRDALSPSMALAAFAAAVVVMVALSPLAGGLGPWGIAVMQLAVAGPAIVIASKTARAPARALGLRAPRAAALVGACLVGLSFWYVNLAVVVPLNEALVGDDPSVTRIAELLSEPALPLWATLVILAALPALCEELLFRGALARALWPALGLAGAIVVQAALFSLFHLSPARLLPTLSFGIVLGVIALVGASTALSALAHALNNATAITLASGAFLPVLTAIDAHPAATLAIAVSATVSGLLLIVSGRDRPARRAPGKGSRKMKGAHESPE